MGVDPLLRQKIWQYLVQIAKGGTTIIITTHYVEEASLANVCGTCSHHLLCLCLCLCFPASTVADPALRALINCNLW